MKNIGFMVFGSMLLGFAGLRFWSPLTVAMLQVDMPVIDYSLGNVADLVDAIVNWTMFVSYGSNALLAGFGLYFVVKGVILRGADKLKTQKTA